MALRMLDAVKLEQPELVLHLGDGIRDLSQLHVWAPNLPVEFVRGNCDGWGGQEEKILELLGHRIWMLHGHTRGVKRSLTRLRTMARKLDVEVVLYGHTHVPLYMQEDGLHILNPGSIGQYGKTEYGVIELEKDMISCQLISML